MATYQTIIYACLWFLALLRAFVRLPFWRPPVFCPLAMCREPVYLSISSILEPCPLKMRSELETGRRLAFVLELIARGEVKAKMPEPSGRQKRQPQQAHAGARGGAGDPSHPRTDAAFTLRASRRHYRDALITLASLAA